MSIIRDHRDYVKTHEPAYRRRIGGHVFNVYQPPDIHFQLTKEGGKQTEVRFSADA